MPLVTLTSDIGVQDFMPGAIKGQLMQANPSFNVIDITHLLSPFNYPQAAYVCRNAIKNFSAGTFHLILINLFHEKLDHLLIVEHNGHYIGCADNGLITMILEEIPQQIVGIPLEKNQSINALYCTNVLANAFSKIAAGASLQSLGDTNVSINVKNPLRPLLGNDWIEGQIIFIDNFGNVIVNISKEAFEEQRKGRRFAIVFKRDESIEKISETYADVPEGEKLAIFNSAGYLEIAMNKGNAANLFGLQSYSEHQQKTLGPQFMNNNIFYQTIKVHFQ
ncbi:S-adenosyl-l-methionine hydroxide adenosyltransferase family protein [Ferruginibacter yonginensis]|uniref:S-adenosyl-l-methionine hydroxide adenosyltransferase family protein n=1 Tax=Ferruginibacter yonginensis TaxID=1310416 RepID=A0ABV8QQN9_9BACT